MQTVINGVQLYFLVVLAILFSSYHFLGFTPTIGGLVAAIIFTVVEMRNERRTAHD